MHKFTWYRISSLRQSNEFIVHNLSHITNCLHKFIFHSERLSSQISPSLLTSNKVVKSRTSDVNADHDVPGGRQVVLISLLGNSSSLAIQVVEESKEIKTQEESILLGLARGNGARTKQARALLMGCARSDREHCRLHRHFQTYSGRKAKTLGSCIDGRAEDEARRGALAVIVCAYLSPSSAQTTKMSTPILPAMNTTSIYIHTFR